MSDHKSGVATFFTFKIQKFINVVQTLLVMLIKIKNLYNG